MLNINVITLFPELFGPFLETSIPGRAAAEGLVRYRVVQLRDFAVDRHGTVDDSPYGGGAGMVLRPEPLFAAVESLGGPGTVVLLSARGVPFSHRLAARYSLVSDLRLRCGHYKAVVHRVTGERQEDG